MFSVLFLSPFNVSVTRTSRGCWFERFQNEGPFHFAEEALLLEAEGKIDFYHVKASQICEEQVQDQETSSNLVY